MRHGKDGTWEVGLREAIVRGMGCPILSSALKPQRGQVLNQWARLNQLRY